MATQAEEPEEPEAAELAYPAEYLKICGEQNSKDTNFTVYTVVCESLPACKNDPMRLFPHCIIKPTDASDLI